MPTPYLTDNSYYTGWNVDSFSNTLKDLELQDPEDFMNLYGFTTSGLNNDDIIREVLTVDPSYGNPENTEYITDLDNWRYREQVRGIESTGEHAHVNYTKNQLVNMFRQMQAGTPHFIGGLLDPETSMGSKVHWVNAFAMQMADQLSFHKYFDPDFMGDVAAQEGEEFGLLEKDYWQRRWGPKSDLWDNAKQHANEWYEIAEKKRREVQQTMYESLMDDPEQKAYMNWIEDEPMKANNWFYPEMFKRGLAIMLPAVTAISTVTLATRGVGLGPAVSAAVATGAMMGLEGSDQYWRAMEILIDEYGMEVADAAPIAAEVQQIYGTFSGLAEAVQIGRVSRILHMGDPIKRSFMRKLIQKLLKIDTPADLTLKKKIAIGALDTSVEAIEGAFIEGAQTVTGMVADEGVRQGYGLTREDALNKIGEEMGPISGFRNYMNAAASEEASEAFWMGFTGELGFGGAGNILTGTARALRGPKAPGTALIPGAGFTPPATETAVETTKPTMPTAGPDEAQSPAVQYTNAIVEQMPGGPFEYVDANQRMLDEGGTQNKTIDKLISMDRRIKGVPEEKIVNLLNLLESEGNMVDYQNVLSMISDNEELKNKVANLRRQDMINLIPEDQRGEEDVPSEAVEAINEISPAEIIARYDAIEDLAQDALEEQGIDIALDIAEGEAPSGVTTTEMTAKQKKEAADRISQQEEDEMEAQHQLPTGEAKQVSVPKPTKQVPAPKPIEIKNINEKGLDKKKIIAFLQQKQEKGGTLAVEKVLTGKGKGIKQANLTVLGKLQTELIPKQNQMPVKEENRTAIVSNIVGALLKQQQAKAPAVTAPKRKKKVKVKEPPAAKKIPVITQEEEDEMEAQFQLPTEEKEAPADKAEAYLAIPDRVEFPPAKSRKEAHAIVDGKKVTLTEEQKDRILKINKGKGSAVLATQGAAQAQLYELGQELIDQQEAPAEVEERVVKDISEKMSVPQGSKITFWRSAKTKEGKATLVKTKGVFLGSKPTKEKGEPSTLAELESGGREDVGVTEMPIQIRLESGEVITADLDDIHSYGALAKEAPAEEVYTGLKKIGSGGQIGADQAGLEVGQELGLETGGTAPPGWITTTGPDPDVLQSFGLVEGESDPKIYRKRTIKNVEDYDGTVIFGNVKSPGSRLTLLAARKANKPVIQNPTAEELRDWMAENNIESLNVAGNRKIDKESVKAVIRGAVGLQQEAPAVIKTGKADKKITAKMIDPKQSIPKYGLHIIKVGDVTSWGSLVRPGPKLTDEHYVAFEVDSESGVVTDIETELTPEEYAALEMGIISGKGAEYLYNKVIKMEGYKKEFKVDISGEKFRKEGSFTEEAEIVEPTMLEAPKGISKESAALFKDIAASIGEDSAEVSQPTGEVTGEVEKAVKKLDDDLCT